MACYNPVPGWFALKPNPETGRYPVVFGRSGADPERPIDIPCGKCIGCRSDQALMWSIRAYHESTLHDYSCFVTLTYSDDHLPADHKIDKKHLQDFFRELRREYPPKSIRYIACGEYGDQTRRPHYHAIIFGEDFRFDKIDLDKDLYTSPTLQKIWGLGNVSIAPVTMASICYVCGYVTKKMSDPDTFNLMSRRPGIGHDWLKKHAEDLARTGTVTIEGREYPVPKRYLDWGGLVIDHLPSVRQEKAKARSAKKDLDWRRKQEANRLAKSKGKKEKI